MESKILLVGAGPMAIEYARVLKALGREVVTVGRGDLSARTFQEATGLPVITGGLESWLTKNTPPRTAIVAVGEKWLGKTTRALLECGVSKILIEKPGGFDENDIAATQEAAQQKGAQVFVAYNRRFYVATRFIQQKIIEEGISSFHFEFTEWGHVIANLEKEAGVKEAWFLANSSHVIDLAFYLGGFPQVLSSFVSGSLPWHPAGAVFTGAGKTAQASFSYHANWAAPGRWGVEILTAKHRWILKPLEKVQCQKLGTVQVEPVSIDDTLDTQFKPGLHAMVSAFLGDKPEGEGLPTLAEQVSHLPCYLNIRDGDSGRHNTDT